jgi:hypothetical protein
MSSYSSVWFDRRKGYIPDNQRSGTDRRHEVPKKKFSMTNDDYDYTKDKNYVADDEDYLNS